MVDVDSLTEAFAEDVQDTDDFYQRIVSSDEEDFGDPDDGSIADNDRHPGLTPGCRTLLRGTQDELDMVDVDSVTGGFAEKLPDADDLYQGMASSDEEDCSEVDDGSIADCERNTWADWCGSVFGTAFGEFPSEADGPQPTVMISDCLFSEEELADVVVSVDGEVPMLPLRRFADVGVAVIPPVADRPVRRIINRLVSRNNRMDEVSVLSWPGCDPLIRIDVANAALSHVGRVCLLYPAGTRCLKGGSVAIALDGRRLDHWRTVAWDPGIVGSRALSACYDCLCLMALFRAVMSLVHHWAEWSVWTGIEAGYCRTITWEERYLPCSHPPCVVDRLCGRTWQIKGPVFIIMLDKDGDNSPLRCACLRGTLGVLSAGRIPLMVIGWIACGGGLVDCSDWTLVDCAVDFSPGGVWISYIRDELWDRSSTDAAPVSALCRIKIAVTAVTVIKSWRLRDRFE